MADHVTTGAMFDMLKYFSVLPDPARRARVGSRHFSSSCRQMSSVSRLVRTIHVAGFNREAVDLTVKALRPLVDGVVPIGSRVYATKEDYVNLSEGHCLSVLVSSNGFADLSATPSDKFVNGESKEKIERDVKRVASSAWIESATKHNEALCRKSVPNDDDKDDFGCSIWFYEEAVKRAERIAQACFLAAMSEELGKDSHTKHNLEPTKLKYLGKRVAPQSDEPAPKRPRTAEQAFGEIQDTIKTLHSLDATWIRSRIIAMIDEDEPGIVARIHRLAREQAAELAAIPDPSHV